MKVAELTAYHVRIPLKRAIKHASHTRTSTDNLVIRCVLEDGTIGFGEGVPREYVTGETIDSAINLVKRGDLASQLDACRDFSAAAALAERVQLPAVDNDDRRCRGNAARCAVELAVLDAYGKHFGKPISAMTQLLAPDVYAPTDWVRYSGAITSASKPLKIRLAVMAMKLYRFRHVKVKVGIAGQDDVYRLGFISRKLGIKVELRVDANEAWKPDDAVDRIRALEPFGITSVEQPVAHADVTCLADVRKQVRVPIMHDESLCSMVDAERALAQQTCDLFNIRLSKCGGFVPSLRLVQFALRNGLGYQLGCQVGETAILSAAGRHFATSVSAARCHEGSYDHFLVREALATKDVSFRWGGWARALPGPGLGIEVDPQALERVTVRKEPILG
jgi:muconate cycloisomerase